MPPFLQVLQNRNFRSLWLGQIFSQIGVNMLLFVLVLRVYETTQSNTAVSLLILMMGIPAIIFGVLAGTLVDQWNKKTVLVAANLVRMVLILGFFISLETSIWIYLLVLAISTTTQFFVPAEAPMIPQIVEGRLLLTANSLFTLTFYTSVITGFVFAGPALKFFGPHYVFLFIAVLLALAAGFVWQLQPEGNPPAGEEKKHVGKDELLTVWGEFWKGLKYILREKSLAEPLILLTASQALIASLASLAPGFAHTVLDIEIKDASFLIMGPAAVGMVVGAAAIGNFGRNLEKKNLINWGVLSAGLFLIFLSAIVRYTHLWLAVVSLFMLGAANSLIDVPSNTLLQENAPANLRGRVYGVLTSLIGGAAILPVGLAGVAADFFGVGKVIFTVGTIIILYGAYRATRKV